MKQRYTVRRGEVSWAVFDNQTGVVIMRHKGRDPARAECKRLNATEQQVRDDQQQSREETI